MQIIPKCNTLKVGIEAPEMAVFGIVKDVRQEVACPAPIIGVGELGVTEGGAYPKYDLAKKSGSGTNELQQIGGRNSGFGVRRGSRLAEYRALSPEFRVTKEPDKSKVEYLARCHFWGLHPTEGVAFDDDPRIGQSRRGAAMRLVPHRLTPSFVHPKNQDDSPPQLIDLQ